MKAKSKSTLSKITFLLTIGSLMLSAAGCVKNVQTAEPDTVGGATTEVSTVEVCDEQEAEKFYEQGAGYELSDAQMEALYQSIEKEGVFDKEYMRLTGAAFNDYDANGMTDVLVCLYEDKDGADPYQDGCLYLFMNDDEPYYIYDDFCCYSAGWIFEDFGADIDNDGYTEIAFCVQGTGCGGAGDCQKFVFKYMDGRLERMELPNDFDYDYDCGLTVQIEKDVTKGTYSAYCPYLDDTIVFDTEQNEDDWGGENSRGYYSPAVVETDGRAFFTVREYLYAGCIANWVGDAVFVLDWDENGKAYVRDWYIEAWDNKIYTPLQKTLEHRWDVEVSFGENETGGEITAYKEFLEGRLAANISDNIYADTSYIEIPAENGFYINELLDEIMDEVTQNEGIDCIESVQYALISCGTANKKMLAVRAYGLSIYSPNDDSDLTMVFDYQDGTLSMIYAADSWARSCTTLYKNGYVSGYGSGGAYCHYAWEGIIGADGVFHESYQAHTEFGSWDNESGEMIEMEITDYTINDEIIYAYYLYDSVTDAQKQKVFEQLKKKAEAEYITADEAWKRVEEKQKSLGITGEMGSEENWITWQTLSLEPSVLQR